MMKICQKPTTNGVLDVHFFSNFFPKNENNDYGVQLNRKSSQNFQLWNKYIVGQKQ